MQSVENLLATYSVCSQNKRTSSVRNANHGASSVRIRDNTSRVFVASGEAFADVFAGGDLGCVVVEPAVELVAFLAISVDAWVRGDLIVGIDRRMIALGFACHHGGDYAARAARVCRVGGSLVAFPELGEHLASEELERLHDVIVAIAAGRTGQDDLIDTAVLVAAQVGAHLFGGANRTAKPAVPSCTTLAPSASEFPAASATASGSKPISVRRLR